MGRGESKVGSGSATPTQAGLDAGILPTEHPLTYGEKDKTLTGQARKKIEEFERTYVNDDIEHIRFVDSSGKVIEENTGNKGSVSNSPYADANGYAFSHNHPREAGALGGTFSTADIASFCALGSNVTVMRAVAKEGVYSISMDKTKGDSIFKRSLLIGDYKKAYRRAHNHYKKRLQKYNDEYKKKTGHTPIWSEESEMIKRAFNEELGELHEWLLNNQKNYGYTYTLERR